MTKPRCNALNRIVLTGIDALGVFLSNALLWPCCQPLLPLPPLPPLQHQLHVPHGLVALTVRPTTRASIEVHVTIPAMTKPLCNALDRFVLTGIAALMVFLSNAFSHQHVPHGSVALTVRPTPRASIEVHVTIPAMTKPRCNALDRIVLTGIDALGVFLSNALSWSCSRHRYTYTSIDACKAACTATGGCNSFAACPPFGNCFLKDLVVTPGVPQKVNADCRTHYTEPCQ